MTLDELTKAVSGSYEVTPMAPGTALQLHTQKFGSHMETGATLGDADTLVRRYLKSAMLDSIEKARRKVQELSLFIGETNNIIARMGP